MFSFIGQSNQVPVEVRGGEIRHGETVLGRTEEADGRWNLYVRPHDLDVVEPGVPGLSGTVSLSRRAGGSRISEFELGPEGRRIEVELPADRGGEPGSLLHVRPRRWQLYPEAASR